MIDRFITNIYRRFLYEEVTLDEFKEMNYNLNKLSDDDLSELLEDEWIQNFPVKPIPVKEKKQIKSNLNYLIHQKQKKSWFNWKVLLTAAALIPFIILGTYLYNYLPTNQNHFMADVKPGSKTFLTLPDKSEVWLNSNSTLHYGSETRNKREVHLSGEAFFHVKKDSKRPFIITADMLKIEVLGTSFNVKAIPDKDLIETSLVEGSIKLILPGKIYQLKPNEKAVYSKKDSSLKIIPTDNELETAWIDNKLKFRSEPFSGVKAKLEEWYNIKIKVDCDRIENDPITGTFNNERLDIVLESLKLQYKFQYEIEGDIVKITCK